MNFALGEGYDPQLFDRLSLRNEEFGRIDEEEELKVGQDLLSENLQFDSRRTDQ